MAKMLIKCNLTQIMCIPYREGNGSKTIIFKPQGDEKKLQELDVSIWAKIKDTPLTKWAVSKGLLVVMASDSVDDDHETVETEIVYRAITAESESISDVSSKINTAIKSGDIKTISAEYPEFAAMIENMVAAAVKANSTDDSDPDDDSDELPATIDELLSDIGNDLSDTDLKEALRDYAKQKHDMKLGNAGVPKMIEMIKEAENGD